MAFYPALIHHDKGTAYGASFPDFPGTIASGDSIEAAVADAEAALVATLEVATGGHIPIVALTAHAMDGDDTDILAAGIDHYMTKPLRKAAIVEVLVQHCPPNVRAIILPDSRIK